VANGVCHSGGVEMGRGWSCKRGEGVDWSNNEVSRWSVVRCEWYG
jgi:hypothetical protein